MNNDTASEIQEKLNEGGFPCPCCDGESQLFLGTLGTVAHLRCRGCGWIHAVKAEVLK